MPAATQTELAKRLGLSRSTIAAALNPNSRVKLRGSTVERVRCEAEKWNYRPNPHARLVRGGRSRTIGIIHYGGLSQVAAERAWHASRAIQKSGYQILSTDLSWTPGGARASCGVMLDAKVEGVVVAGLNDPASIGQLGELQRNRIPLVSLSGNSLAGVPHVRGDARRAMNALAEHLIGLGRRRLILLSHDSPAFQSGSYFWAFMERRKGFRSALAKAGGRIAEVFSGRRGAPVEGRVITSPLVPDPFDPYRIGRQLMERILREPVLPDAVLCGNDDWAFGAMSACFEAGVQIPAEIALTGYDNNSFGQYLAVPLTTVAQPSRAMAEYAVNRLWKMIAGEAPPEGAPLKLFSCKLIVRSSCGNCA